MSKLIFGPVCVLVAWTLFQIFRLGYLRYIAIRSKAVPVGYYATFQGESPESEELRQVGAHVRNLFEAPMLFYLATVIAHTLEVVDIIFIGLSWSYVSLRLVHGLIHVSSNDVRHRFYAFASSMVVLTAIWFEIIERLI